MPLGKLLPSLCLSLNNLASPEPLPRAQSQAGQCWACGSNRCPPGAHSLVGETELSPDRGDTEWAKLGRGQPGGLQEPGADS